MRILSGSSKRRQTCRLQGISDQRGTQASGGGKRQRTIAFRAAAQQRPASPVRHSLLSVLGVQARHPKREAAWVKRQKELR